MFCLVRSLATLAVLGLFLSAVLAVGFHRKLVHSVIRENGLFYPIIFLQRLQPFSAAGFFSLWAFCSSGSRFRWGLTCLRVFVPGAEVVCRLSFQLCFPCGCAVQVFGVMRCDRFFVFPSHVGSHLSGGLLPLLLSPGVFRRINCGILGLFWVCTIICDYGLCLFGSLLCTVVSDRLSVFDQIFLASYSLPCVLGSVLKFRRPSWQLLGCSLPGLGSRGFCFSVWGPSSSA